MAKQKIKVYTEFNNIKENQEFMAIKMNNVIKYIDFANNKMIVDMENDILIRENNDYLFHLDFINEIIHITIKNNKASYDKTIKVLLKEKKKNSYLVRYFLIDEKIVNELYIKY